MMVLLLVTWESRKHKTEFCDVSSGLVYSVMWCDIVNLVTFVRLLGSQMKASLQLHFIQFRWFVNHLNRFWLTVCVFPLRKITMQVVVKALTMFFSLLSESQGALERFHQTLKTMTMVFAHICPMYMVP